MASTRLTAIRGLPGRLASIACAATLLSVSSAAQATDFVRIAGGMLAIADKWMHDLFADNRFQSDYGLLTDGWKF